MKKIKLVGVTLALFCTLSMAACGSTQNGQETQSEPPAYSQGEIKARCRVEIRTQMLEKEKKNYLEI